MPTKKPAKLTAARPRVKPATTKRPARPSLPALSEKPNLKVAAANDADATAAPAKSSKSEPANEKLERKLRRNAADSA